MEKNIIVVDEHGRKYGATYPRRAKRLVKQGRARFLASGMLCLACPPDQGLEGHDMSVQAMEDRTAEKAAKENRYTIEYCLWQIEEIAHQTDYLDRIIAELHGPDSDSCGHNAALSDIVKSREATNQQMLRFYEKVYDDLKTPVKVEAAVQKAHLQGQILKIMEKTLENSDYPADKVADMFNGAFDAIRHVDD